MYWDVMVRIQSYDTSDVESITAFVRRAFEAQGQGVEIMMVLKEGTIERIQEQFQPRG